MVALDGAGWHGATDLTVPKGIHLVPSPELRPAEHFWPLVDKVVANWTPTDLEAVLVTRCRTLRADRHTIKCHTRYHWWPRERRRRHAQRLVVISIILQTLAARSSRAPAHPG